MEVGKRLYNGKVSAWNVNLEPFIAIWSLFYCPDMYFCVSMILNASHGSSSYCNCGKHFFSFFSFPCFIWWGTQNLQRSASPAVNYKNSDKHTTVSRSTLHHARLLVNMLNATCLSAIVASSDANKSSDKLVLVAVTWLTHLLYVCMWLIGC